MLLCYLEVKQRRVKLADYGDVVTPVRKHHTALMLQQHGIRFVMATRYACGSLVELDLSLKPARIGPMKRRDRTETVEHAFYGPGQFNVLREAK